MTRFVDRFVRSLAALAAATVPLATAAAVETFETSRAVREVPVEKSKAAPERPWLPIAEGAARFRLAFGRIQADRTGSFDDRSRSFEYVDGLCESYRVGGVSDRVRLTYERRCPKGATVSLAVEGDGELRLTTETAAADGPRRMELVQPAEGWISLAVSDSGAERTLRAPSIWHLYLQEPELCERRLEPALRELNIRTEFSRTGADLAERLVEYADAHEPTSREETLRWIADLADPSFHVRRAADDRLRAMGPALVAWIRHVPIDRMDREQRDRLRAILASLEASSDDRPERLTEWLADDPWVWGELVEHSDDRVRDLAVRKIEQLTGVSVGEASGSRSTSDLVVRARELCQQERRTLR